MIGSLAIQCCTDDDTHYAMFLITKIYNAWYNSDLCDGICVYATPGWHSSIKKFDIPKPGKFFVENKGGGWWTKIL